MTFLKNRTQCKIEKAYVYVGISVICARTFTEARAPLTKPRSSHGSCLRPLPPAVRSRSSLHKPKLAVFPLRSVATRDDSMYGTDGHETRRLGAELRPDKPRDSLVRDGVTRRVREAAFFIIRRPSRFCEGAPTPVRRIRRVVIARGITDAEELGGHEEERPRNSAEGNSDLGARRDLDSGGERRPPSLEGKKTISRSVYTLRGTLF